MTRTYSELINDDINNLLDILADKSSSSDIYQSTMTDLGHYFGDIIFDKIDDKNSTVSLACTVEDADFLAKGIINRLEDKKISVSFACFWNKRFSPFNMSELKVAPILKKYQEPTNSKIDYLIIVKSIISGACVVKTNLTNLIQKIDPTRIFVVAPVIYLGAENSLKKHFEPEIYNKFEFLYFASDDERTNQGEVIPGIGGSVYERLGFDGQDAKNRHTPQIVKTRRASLVSR